METIIHAFEAANVWRLIGATVMTVCFFYLNSKIEVSAPVGTGKVKAFFVEMIIRAVFLFGIAFSFAIIDVIVASAWVFASKYF